MSKKVRLLWFLIYFITIGNATENNDTSEYMYDILRFNETVHHINAFFDVIYYGFSGKFMIQRDSIEKMVYINDGEIVTNIVPNDNDQLYISTVNEDDRTNNLYIYNEESDTFADKIGTFMQSSIAICFSKLLSKLLVVIYDEIKIKGTQIYQKDTLLYESENMKLIDSHASQIHCTEYPENILNPKHKDWIIHFDNDCNTLHFLGNHETEWDTLIALDEPSPFVAGHHNDFITILPDGDVMTIYALFSDFNFETNTMTASPLNMNYEMAKPFNLNQVQQFEGSSINMINYYSPTMEVRRLPEYNAPKSHRGPPPQPKPHIPASQNNDEWFPVSDIIDGVSQLFNFEGLKQKMKPTPTLKPTEPLPPLCSWDDTIVGSECMVKNHRYNVIKKLGEGTHGQVYQVQTLTHYDSKTKLPVYQSYALKRFGNDHDEIKQHSAEVMVLYKLSTCPSVVNIYGSQTVDEKSKFNTYPTILLQFVSGGDVDGFMNKHFQLIDADVAVKLIFQFYMDVGNALMEMSKIGKMHMDIKPQNILVERYQSGLFKFYLADFSIVVDYEKWRKRQAQTSGTPTYLSPEQVHSIIRRDNQARSGSCIDRYSMYTVALEMIGRVCAPKSIATQLLCKAGQIVGCTKRYGSIKALLCKTGEEFRNIHIEFAKGWRGRIDGELYSKAFIRRHNAIAEAREYMQQIPIEPDNIIDQKGRKVLELAYNQIARDNINSPVIGSNPLYCVTWDSWFRRMQTVN